MARINLLPWREQLRKERIREFASIAAGAAIFTALVVVYVHFHINGIIENQDLRNGLLEKEIAQLDEQIGEIRALETEKEQLLARMNIIQDLQSRRPLIVYLFDELVRKLPEGVYLTTVKQEQSIVLLEGIAQSNARVSDFMKNLDESPLFHDPRLAVIEATDVDGTRASRFTLRVKQVNDLAALVEGGTS